MVSIKKWAFFLAPKIRISARKSVFYRTHVFLVRSMDPSVSHSLRHLLQTYYCCDSGVWLMKIPTQYQLIMPIGQFEAMQWCNLVANVRTNALWVKPLRNLEFNDLAKWEPPPPFLVEMIFSDTKYLRTIVGQFHFLSNMWYEMRWTIWYHIL